MTKEEIRQEAEERVNICTPYHTGSFIQGYIAGAEPRENKIADIKANFDLAIEGRDIKIKELETENNKLLDVINNQDVKIADLEKENTELDMKRKAERKIFQGIVEKKNEQLTKATEHIKQLLGCLKQDANDPETNYYICQYMDKAEQFIKEIEKC